MPSEGSEEKGIPPAPILAVRDWMGHASVEETEGISTAIGLATRAP